MPPADTNATVTGAAMTERPSLDRPILILLRLEGLAAAIAASAGFALLGGDWWLFALLILAPDLSMLGYLAGPRVGAWVYNLAHSHIVPALLAGAGWFAPPLLPLACIWIAHIGFDRALGYGLKSGAGFRLTHLGRIGRDQNGTSSA